MSQKLNCILLVDDDETTNFLHSMVIKKMNCTKEIVIKENGSQALDYLKSEQDGKFPRPDLIILDINMPVMNGWEFLEEYKKLNSNQMAKQVMVMLTSSLDPIDDQKSKRITQITDFIKKPLTTEMMESVLDNYFK